MAALYYREFATLWFKASVGGGAINLTLGGEDPTNEQLASAAPDGSVEVNDTVHDRILYVSGVTTTVRIAVQDDPTAGATTAVSTGGVTWTHTGNYSYKNVAIPSTMGDEDPHTLLIQATVAGTSYTRTQLVKIKHRQSV